MFSRKRFVIFCASTICMIFAMGILAITTIHAQNTKRPEKTKYGLSRESSNFILTIHRTLLLLENSAYTPLTKKARNELFSALYRTTNKELKKIDKYGFIFSPKQSTKFKRRTDGGFVGMGILMTIHPSDMKKAATILGEKRVLMKKLGLSIQLERKLEEEFLKESGTIGKHGVVIRKILPNSGAEKADLQRGWIIHFINNIPVENMLLSEMSTIYLGVLGTKVILEIYKSTASTNVLPTRKELVKVEVTLGPVNIPSITTVRYLIKQGDKKVAVGYMKIREFSASVEGQFTKYLNELLTDKVDRLIIDVRRNPGGLVRVVTGILEQLVPPLVYPDNIFLRLKDRWGNIISESVDNPLIIPIFKGNIVVLIDKYSASASEILAGVLRDYNVATLIGEKTYGKGSVQGVITLPNKVVIKFTKAHYFLPNGESVEGIGIEPDITIIDDPQTVEDEVLERALDFLASVKDKSPQPITEEVPETPSDF